MTEIKPPQTGGLSPDAAALAETLRQIVEIQRQTAEKLTRRKPWPLRIFGVMRDVIAAHLPLEETLDQLADTNDYHHFQSLSDACEYLQIHSGRGFLSWEDRMPVNAVLEKRSRDADITLAIHKDADPFAQAHWKKRNHVDNYSLTLAEFVAGLQRHLEAA